MNEILRNFINAVTPTVFWILFITCVIIIFRRDIRTVLQSFAWRMRLGAPIKVSALEIGALEARPNRINASLEKEHGIRPDVDGLRQNERAEYYRKTRRIMLVHRLFRSAEPGQLYDLLVYLVPAYGGNLAAVSRVEYFFGEQGWNNRIFPATDRARGFPIFTAAYGPFLCTAEVFFTDGTSIMLHRFIDFEMGDFAAPPEPTKIDHTIERTAA